MDAGNTIPFIARFRKDQTGGLDAEQVLAIKQGVTSLRALAERKTFVLKAIESHGQLNENLANEIKQATNSRRVEDLYFPFKAKKQTLALTARQQGLDPLAEEIIGGQKNETELAAIALEFVRVDRGVASIDEVMAGVGHLIAERFSERSDVRRELRRAIWTGGMLSSKSVKPAIPETAAPSEGATTTENDATAIEPSSAVSAPSEVLGTEPTAATEPHDETLQTVFEHDEENHENSESESSVDTDSNESESEHVDDPETSSESTANLNASVESASADRTEPTPLVVVAESPATEPAGETVAVAKPPVIPAKRQEKRSDKKKPTASPFADYEDFTESLKRVPNHRVLAINRGERAGLLKAKVKIEPAPLEAKVTEMLVPAEHPMKAFLNQCALDAFNRLIFPSLEREVRRELTETAEQHALRVFSENLKALLLQAPVRDKRILAIDPGYKSGCTLAVLDEQGTVLHTDRLFVVGNQVRRDENRKKLSQLVKVHKVDVIAIGNGTACRETEQLVSDAIRLDLQDLPTKYVIVNEAGTSAYSTSEIGKEELPGLQAGARSAVSIGRRLLDPLSELVKIAPANLGVGLYQHDIKAKHLADSLDEVVEACVNHVGVNINTASTSLLRYVAGLNQLTARRLVETRQENAVTNRQQLKQIAGIGDATFVQAAGFLRIYGGDEPLDETAIHPESYPIVEKILEKVGVTVVDWFAQRRRKTKPAAIVPVVSVPEAQPTPVGEIVVGEPAASELVVGETITQSTPPRESVQANAEPESIPVPAPIPEPVREAVPAAPEPRPPNPLIGLDAVALAAELGIGELLTRDIIESLQRPSHDPRSKNLGPVFRTGIIKLEDLQPEMKLDSQIVNVVDFGVFVDVGLGYSCLVHVSELSRGFIRDLYQQFAVGDVLTTWVKEIDLPRRRVKLTAMSPGTKKFERRSKPKQDEQKSEAQPSVGAQPQTGQRRPGQRSDRPAGQTYGNRQPSARQPGPAPASGGRPNGQSAPRYGNQRRDSRPFQKQPRVDRPSKPKPVKPITDDMLSGSKPMRSFSDLAQFFQKKDEPEKET